MLETITSAANPLLKDVKRAIARGGLTEQGWCVAETAHLLEEAVRSGCEIHMVLAADAARLPSGVRAVRVPDALLRSVSGTETSPGVIALVQPREWTLDRLFAGEPLVAVLDGLQDPGNVGTIVRAAEAFGASGVLMLKGTAGPYNSKTLRASAGSLFRMPFVFGVEPAAAVAALREHDIQLFAGVAGASPVSGVDLAGRCAIAIGNEARGVSGTLRAAAQAVSIPTTGVESLNAAVAASILLYEARRQRSGR